LPYHIITLFDFTLKNIADFRLTRNKFRLYEVVQEAKGFCGIRFGVGTLYAGNTALMISTIKQEKQEADCLEDWQQAAEYQQ